MDLFGERDAQEPSVAVLEPLYGAIDVTWPKVPAGRHLCQDCVDLIHGRSGGAHPRVATARRKGPVSDRLLCAEHAEIHRSADEKAKKVHADRVAANKATRSAIIASKGYGKTREHA
jgi:hypothetical protein